MEYPAMLYKADGTMLLWDGEMFDHVVVNDEDELKAAKADGYSVEKPKAKAAKRSSRPLFSRQSLNPGELFKRAMSTARDTI
jgi:hypothetical protein